MRGAERCFVSSEYSQPAVVVACDPSTGPECQASLRYILRFDSKMTSKSQHGKGGKMRNGQRRLEFFFQGIFVLLYSRKRQERKPRKQESVEDNIDYSAIVLLSIFIHWWKDYKSQRPMMLTAR